MRYFLTGATGFIGRRLARQLVADHHEVVAVARDPAKASELAAIGVELRAGDVTDKASMRAPMAGADGVFHLAGWYRLDGKDRAAAQGINVDGTRNVLELMEELQIRKGVYTSTLAVFGDTHGQIPDESFRVGGPWITEYDRTKWMAHYEVAEPMIRRGLPLVIVQPGVVYGPRDHSDIAVLFRQYLRRRLRAIPRPSRYCWGHVDDIARAHVLAMERGRPGQSYIVCGEPHTLIEAFEIAERITGITLPRFRPSGRFLRVMGALLRSERFRAAAATYLGNDAKARRELGLVHRPLEEGLRETFHEEAKAMGLALPG